MTWCFLEEASTYGKAVLARLGGEDAITSAIWPLEVANALVVAERRWRVRQDQTTDFLRQISALPITVDEEGVARAWGPVLGMARAYGLTAYAASYLELSYRLSLPLATLDGDLRRAAGRLGVALVA
ncbi:MAG: type II toxin-antitoxin system VapC family toxin [Chloroflexi bacterium]|nr:type II toxin-antitoxin system VapC family toxin [Chloroflexota bacterium]